jgi:prepilin-type processing-associated H-X9-DG protein
LALRDFKLKATGAAYGYGYNLQMSAPLDSPPQTVSRLTDPCRTALLVDAAQVNTFQAPASPERPMLEEFYFVSTNETTAHFRHRAVANAAFCDGHVAHELPLPNSIDPRLPRHRVGRLRPEVLRLD